MFWALRQHMTLGESPEWSRNSQQQPNHGPRQTKPPREHRLDRGLALVLPRRCPPRVPKEGHPQHHRSNERAQHGGAGPVKMRRGLFQARDQQRCSAQHQRGTGEVEGPELVSKSAGLLQGRCGLALVREIRRRRDEQDGCSSQGGGYAFRCASSAKFPRYGMRGAGCQDLLEQEDPSPRRPAGDGAAKHRAQSKRQSNRHRHDGRVQGVLSWRDEFVQHDHAEGVEARAADALEGSAHGTACQGQRSGNVWGRQEK